MDGQLMEAFGVMLDSVTAADVGRNQLNGILDWWDLVSTAVTRAYQATATPEGMTVSITISSTHGAWLAQSTSILRALVKQMDQAAWLAGEAARGAAEARTAAAAAYAQAAALQAQAAAARETAAAAAGSDSEDAAAVCAAASADALAAEAAASAALASAHAAEETATRLEEEAARCNEWAQAACDAHDYGAALARDTTAAYRPLASAVAAAGGPSETADNKRYYQ